MRMALPPSETYPDDFLLDRPDLCNGIRGPGTPLEDLPVEVIEYHLPAEE